MSNVARDPVGPTDPDVVLKIVAQSWSLKPGASMCSLIARAIGDRSLADVTDAELVALLGSMP